MQDKRIILKEKESYITTDENGLLMIQRSDGITISYNGQHNYVGY